MEAEDHFAIYLADFDKLLPLLGRLMLSLEGSPIPTGDRWRNDAQPIAGKLLRHLLSMRMLVNGIELDLGDKGTHPLLDHASISILVRAAIETFLVFHYIYGPGDEDVCIFRHATWKLSGLQDRQRLKPQYEDHRSIQQKEQGDQALLRAQIEKSPHFLRYPKKQRPKLLKGEWRIGRHWTDLAVDAGYHRVEFDNLYNHLCSYSHSGYISALQIGQAAFPQQQQLVRPLIAQCNMVTARFIRVYAQQFGTVLAALAKEDEGALLVEKWWRFARSLHALHQGLQQ